MEILIAWAALSIIFVLFGYIAESAGLSCFGWFMLLACAFAI